MRKRFCDWSVRNCILFLLSLLLFVMPEMSASEANFNALNSIPTTYKGRFRPLQATAQLLALDLYGNSDPQGSPTDHFWQMHFYGHERFDRTPLFFVGEPTLKIMLGLDPQRTRFSYDELHQALFVNEKSSSPVISTLIQFHYNKAFEQPGNRNRRNAQELSSLMPGLVVEQRQQMLHILSVPASARWEHLKKGTSFSLSSTDRRQADAVQSLMQKLERYRSFAGTFPMALPIGNEGRWVSLKELKLRPDNFTAYSDPAFREIQEAYLYLESVLNSPQQPLAAQALSKRLLEGYGEIAGTPYAQAIGKQLFYPTMAQLKAEELYYQIPLFTSCLLLYALAAVYWAFSCKLALKVTLSAYLLHSSLLVLRCYILMRPPVSNIFETLLFVPWVAVSCGFLFKFFLKSEKALAASTIMAVLLMAIAWFNDLHYEMENVQAVLDSQFWLAIHVLMVVGSYGVFVLAGLLAHFYLVSTLVRNNKPSSLTPLILQCLYLGTALLVVGTILGGIWAAQSWGRFWDWDPKESWAFISSCLYLAWIHAFRFGRIGPIGLAFGAVIGLLAITFTWYGVNYILGTGLHSYGFGNGGEWIYYSYIAGELLFLGIMGLFYSKKCEDKKKSSENP